MSAGEVNESRIIPARLSVVNRDNLASGGTAAIRFRVGLQTTSSTICRSPRR
jgi:hypothetical protein